MDIAQLKEEFANLHNENGKVLNKAAEDKRGLTAEEKQVNDRRFARMDEIKDLVESAKKLAGAKFEAGDIENFQSNKENLNKGGKPDVRKAFNAFLSNGESNRELFTIDSSTGSGVLIPELVATPHNVRKQFNAFRAAIASRGYAPLVSSSTVTMKLPVFDDDSNAGAAQSESATSQTVAEPSVSELTLSPTLYTSKGEWFSNTTLLAPGFDIAAYVLPRLTTRLDLGQEAAWVTHLASNATNGATAATTSSITYAKLLDWEHSLRPSYRRDGVMIVSDSFYKLIRGLVDSQNRPLIELNPQTMEESIHGTKIFVSDNVAAVGAGATVGYFASADALKIYDAGGLRIAVYTKYPARPDQTGYEVFANGDFDFVPDGVRTFKMAAS